MLRRPCFALTRIVSFFWFIAAGDSHHAHTSLDRPKCSCGDRTRDAQQQQLPLCRRVESCRPCAADAAGSIPAPAVAKSFDNIFELQEKIYLFLFARQASLWQRYPAAPPPLNLLSVPFHLVSMPLSMCQAVARRGGQFSRRRISEELPPAFAFPEKWLKRQSVHRLSGIANGFIADHSSDVVREDRFKHECVYRFEPTYRR
jgi:hypothetical protein